MKAHTILEVVRKCIGPTSPIGDERIDGVRRENLQLLITVVHNLMGDIRRVVDVNQDAKEVSKQRAVRFAREFLSNFSS